jgi:transcription-repair coupling factor (superfamily II helicase)
MKTSKDNRLKWANLKGSSASLNVSEFARSFTTAPILIVASDMNQLSQWHRELNFFTKNLKLPILTFPDWETLPFDQFSPHEDIVSERLLTLYSLLSAKRGIVLTSINTLMHRLLPQQHLVKHAFVLSVGDQLDPLMFREKLVNSGYHVVSQVMTHGELSIRGAVLDIFPMGSNKPYRIEMLDNEIESLRSFDPDSQRSLEKTNSIHLLPAREYPLDPEGVAHFRSQWRTLFSGNPLDSIIYQKISKGEAAAGAEYYLPLFFEQTQTLLDYLPSETQLIFLGDIHEKAQQFWDEIQKRYEQLCHDVARPLCTPLSLFIPSQDLFSIFKPFAQIQIHTEILPESANTKNFDTLAPPDLFIDHKAKQPLAKLTQLLEANPERILFCAETTGRKEILLELLKEVDIRPALYASWQDFLADDKRLGIIVASLDQGLWLRSEKVILLTETTFFGEQVKQRRLRKRKEIDPDTMFRNLTELSIGAPVVHIDHGVGRYLGLQVIPTGDIEAEYLTLEYAGGDKIYVPVSSLHLISRYIGPDSDQISLTKLGTRQWEKVKQRTAEQIRDAAAELLEIYGRRQASVGFAFPKPNKDFLAFRAAFPFEETPDQSKAIDALIKDMTSAHCMDRLVCGDVGFGKTEVAMQAAFLAVQGGKQVAVLVPTTLLANQHWQSFQNRFADWPIKIASLSRLRSSKEQTETLKELADGKVDIVIGTHKLLQPSIKFKDLGLLIVDEEQRFGVHQKEKIKALRANVDILTLTATPIPRTLNMALAGTRDLSIIATPPARRLSVKTFVYSYETSIIREAILREILRGGQVYFLHNDIDSIYSMSEKIAEIVPEAKITVGHGQMGERNLERVMSDFYHQKFNVLVSTTIIESGIDVPTANTILINQANRFGLAQLHQLRGRVGRSHHQAYAYLLIPFEKSVSRDAEKRLDAISKLEELGAGFQLASYDLEIRGAGELLGDKQSGHIEAIGFTLYMELLEEAVQSLKENKEPNFEKSKSSNVEIDLQLPALIPELYVPDVHIRLTLYKRLADCKNKEAIQELKSEMIDRFGALPAATENLLQIAYLKLHAQNLGITKIDIGAQYGYLHFNENPKINSAKIIQLIQKSSDLYQLQGPQKFRFKLNNLNKKDYLPMVWEVLQKITD